MQPKPDKAAETFKRGAIQGVVVRDLKKQVDERGRLPELFRHDELKEEFSPRRAYISQSELQVQRGLHEHVDQADIFRFLGPSNFKMRLWDNRPDSETYKFVMTLFVGRENTVFRIDD
jgi:dTDP-4-dehydrorhamnose 3,5-epimerase